MQDGERVGGLTLTERLAEILDQNRRHARRDFALAYIEAGLDFLAREYGDEVAAEEADRFAQHYAERVARALPYWPQRDAA